MYRRFGKRLMDVTIASLALLILSPLLLTIVILVRLALGKPVLFVQTRPGRFGQPFRLYKFRTLTGICTPDGALASDGERMTRLGRFLRGASLDELPEFFNVLRGEMSLVGPRPLLMEYLERYDTFQMRRHEVRPGITGWAQVNGRNAITWEQKFALDVWYVDRVSFPLDLRILSMTLGSVIRREGVTGENEATVRPFRGNALEGH